MTIRTSFLLYASCAIEYNNTFLLIKRPLHKPNAGLLAFPGGGVEVSDGVSDRSNDILRTTIKREILEEVGLRLEDPLEYVTSPYHTQDGNRYHFLSQTHEYANNHAMS